MALIKSVRGFLPQFGENCFFADNASIIGDVIMGNDCSVWFNAVVFSITGLETLNLAVRLYQLF